MNANELLRALLASGRQLPGDEVLKQWKHQNILVGKLPDDPAFGGVLRVSIGGGAPDVPGGYCRFRGNKQRCIALIERALEALRNEPD